MEQIFASDSMASRISLRDDGGADGVVYFDREGKRAFPAARAIIVSGYAIETPRLLLKSACRGMRTVSPTPVGRSANISWPRPVTSCWDGLTN